MGRDPTKWSSDPGTSWADPDRDGFRGSVQVGLVDSLTMRRDTTFGPGKGRGCRGRGLNKGNIVGTGTTRHETYRMSAATETWG